MATEHPISVVASEFFYIVVFLHGITLGYPTQKLLTFLIPALAKVSISCKYRKKEEENAIHFPLYIKFTMPCLRRGRKQTSPLSLVGVVGLKRNKCKKIMQ